MSYRNQPEDVESKPQGGARLPRGKDMANAEDSLGHDSSGHAPKQNQHEFDAKEVPGAARKAKAHQILDTAMPAPKRHATPPQDDSNS